MELQYLDPVLNSILIYVTNRKMENISGSYMINEVFHTTGETAHVLQNLFEWQQNL